MEAQTQFFFSGFLRFCDLLLIGGIAPVGGRLASKLEHEIPFDEIPFGNSNPPRKLILNSLPKSIFTSALT